MTENHIETETERGRWALRKAITGGVALTITSVVFALIFWIEALHKPGVLVVSQALLVSFSAIFFAWMAMKTMRKKRLRDAKRLQRREYSR